MTEGPVADRRVFNGRYEIVRQIARGGMAEVYLAKDLLLDRRVALKVLFPELSTDLSFVERFRREAQAAANLTHPNIVSIYDWGEEKGTYFIVMEYVEGRSLANLLRAQGPMDPRRAAEIGASMAAALAAAHRGGVVHRDVKPGNVLIDVSGDVKVTDFGIARAADTTDDLTQTGSVLGTAAYFSPEQAQGFNVDARSDVYSLGVVLYEMVTGRPPFTGKSPVSIAYKHVREQPVPPRTIEPSVPQDFEAIVLHAMEKDPEDRYTSADEVRADLLRFGQGRAVAAPAPVPLAATQAITAQRYPPDARTRIVAGAAEPEQRKTGAYFALLLGLVGVLAVLLFLLGQQLGVFDTGKSTPLVDVPDVIDRPVESAKQAVEDAGFVADVQPEENDADPDTVFAQDPPGGTRADQGSTIVLRVSSGPSPVAIPRVIGQSRADAEDELRSLGFEVAVETREDDDAEPDTVLDQNPASGSKAAKGSTVTIMVSSGKAAVVVPDVTGKDSDVAANELGRAGFDVKRVTESSTDVESGKVIKTTPAGGTEAEKGSTVTMVVSSGVEQVTVPDVTGLTEADASARLNALGFQVESRTIPVSDSNEDGRVITQTPSAGTKANKGSTVQIRVGRSITL